MNTAPQPYKRMQGEDGGGRPPDEFVWDHVSITKNAKSKEAWKCNYCGVVRSGKAPRIRNHLAGQGNDIKGCTKVPDGIRDQALRIIEENEVAKRAKALRETPRKRGRRNSPAAVEEDEDNEGVVDVTAKLQRREIMRRNASDMPPPPETREISRSYGALANTNNSLAGTEAVAPAFQGPSSSDAVAPIVVAERREIMSNYMPPPVGPGGLTNNNNNNPVVTEAVAPFQGGGSSSSSLSEFDISQILSDMPPAGSLANTISNFPVVTAEPFQGVPSSSNRFNAGGANNVAERAAHEELCVTDAFLKLLMCNNFSSADPFQGVPNEISHEALKRTLMKRRVGEDNDGVNVASARSETEVSPLLITKGANEIHVTNALVKFFMCQKISADFDFTKDPNFREFLERARQYGIPSSLLQGDSLIVEKSLVNIKEEVNQYMLMVKESWKTTGCTLMGFNLNKMKGRFLTPYKYNYVLGFYCPKGFIFVEAPHLIGDIGDTLKKHSPSLDFDDVTHVIYHSESSGGVPLCELSDQSSSTWTTNVAHEFCSGINLFPCLRHTIEVVGNELCEGLERARSLIKKAEKIHQCIVDSSLCNWYYKTLQEKGFREFADEKKASPISCFLSIMMLEDDLKMRLLYHLRFEEFIKDRAELEAILDDSKFWADGRELKRALTLVLKISDLMDTLVPTAGYLGMGLDKVKQTLFTDYRPMQEETFWRDICSNLSHTIVRKQAADYLNPFHFLQANVQENHQLKQTVKLTLRNLFKEEQEAIDEQLQRYSDVCNNLLADIDELDNYHPVKWWEQCGHDLPLLRKHAIKMLSQPVSCMCNQVKKCMFQLEGAADYILRLNVRMMEEFRNLGANIYKPIDLQEIVVPILIDPLLKERHNF